ncbi:MAG: hypothetical protein IT434_11475 [Phycisphaerales bacterium]|jgi:hypothetical protein|nr:hypothetical protein [Phycisphaerales bacterium]
MSHAAIDRTSLELARRVAEGLSTHPEWIDLARRNMSAWSAQNADAPALLACYREWRDILAGPIGGVVSALLDPGPEGQRLRQNSPFAGALAPREVWDIKRRCRDESSAA